MKTKLLIKFLDKNKLALAWIIMVLLCCFEFTSLIGYLILQPETNFPLLATKFGFMSVIFASFGYYIVIAYISGKITLEITDLETIVKNLQKISKVRK